MENTSVAIALSGLSFLMTVIWGSPLIRLLKAWKIGKIIREDGPDQHTEKMGTPTMGGFMILILSLFFEGPDFSIKPLPYYISLGWLSILSAVAFTLCFVVLSRKEVRVSEINVWKFIIPLLGAAFGWIMIAGEKPQWYTVAGMILIAASILIIYFRGIYARLSGFERSKQKK